jgi:hypothetical protein
VLQIWFSAERKITHDITNQLIAGFSQILDELGVQFVVCVPGSTSQGDGGLDTLKHVYLPGDVLFGKVRNATPIEKASYNTHLHGLDALDEALLSERLQTSIDNCLVQTGLGLEMFRPNALISMFIPLSEGGR